VGNGGTVQISNEKAKIKKSIF